MKAKLLSALIGALVTAIGFNLWPNEIDNETEPIMRSHLPSPECDAEILHRPFVHYLTETI